MKMQTYRYTIAAGESEKIKARGRFIRGMASDAPYQVRFDGGQLVAFQTGIAFDASPDEFQEVEIVNNQAASQAIEVVISDGYVDDNRLVGQVDISGGIRSAANRSASQGAVTIGTSALLVRAADSARGSLLLQNRGAVSVYVGTTSGVTTATGVEVASGAVLVLTLATDVYAISGSAGNDVRWLEEIL